MTTNTNPQKENTMTTDRMAELAEWWKTAERGIAREGDVVIQKVSDEQYNTFIAFEDDSQEYDDFRILERAPQPKPSWRDAVAVIAQTPQAERQVWRPDGEGTYYGTEGDKADDYELRDVTPLIEAKVADEMVLAALNASTGLNMSAVTSFKRDEIEDMRYALTAALGLETY